MKIDFKPSKKQWEVWDAATNIENPATLILMGGSAGGGKSFLGSVWLITQCLRYENVRYVVARHSLKALKESTLNTIISLLKEWKVSYNYNQKDGFIEFDNGSKIILMELSYKPSDSNYSAVGSMEVTGVFIDEVNMIPEQGVEVISSRCRWRNAEYGIKPVTLMSCNPSLGWVRDRFVMDGDGNPPKLDKHEIYIPFSVFDNPNKEFRQNYVEQLKRLKSQAERERLLFGNWSYVDSNDAVFYSGFDGRRNLVDNLFNDYYDPTKALYLTFDFNIFPYISCLAAQAFPEEKKIRIFTEILGTPEKKQNRTIKTAELAGEKFKNHRAAIFVTGDPSGIREDTRSEQGQNDFSQIMRGLRNKGKSAKLKLTKKAPSVSLRGEWLNILLAGEDPEGWGIEIDINNCRKLTEDFIYGLAAEDGGKDKKKVVDPKTGVKHEKYHHMSDAFDYLILAIRTKSFYVHKRGGRGASSSKPVRPEVIPQRRHTW